MVHLDRCSTSVSGALDLFTGIRRLNDRTHRFLVESFETAFALEIFQMAPQGPFAHELVELVLVDQPIAQKSLGPFAADRPSFSFRKRLSEEGQIGKRFHRADARPGQPARRRSNARAVQIQGTPEAASNR